MKQIKNLLIELGFHHSWGYWISNNHKGHRINIKEKQHRVFLSITKNYNHYDLADGIGIDRKNIKIDEIKEKLVNYFLK